MTDRQIEIADAILRYIVDKPIVHPFDIHDEFMGKRGYSSQEVHSGMALLSRKMLIVPFPGRNNSIMISDLGLKAVAKGIVQFDKDNESVEYYKWRITRNSYILLIISIVLAFIGLVISILK